MSIQFQRCRRLWASLPLTNNGLAPIFFVFCTLFKPTFGWVQTLRANETLVLYPRMRKVV